MNMTDENSVTYPSTGEVVPPGPKNFLSLPGELRNRIYDSVLSIHTSAGRQQEISSNKATGNNTLLLPNANARPKIFSFKTVSASAGQHPRRYSRFDTRNPDCVYWDPRTQRYRDLDSETEPAYHYENQRAAHIPALLRSHPTIRREASILYYSTGPIVIQLDTSLLLEFRHFTSRVLAPLHAGLFFSNPEVTLNLVGHVGANDMEYILDWLVKCVPAAREWRYEIDCRSCRGCKLGQLLRRNIRAGKAEIERLRLFGGRMGNEQSREMYSSKDASEQGRLAEIRRSIEVAAVVLASMEKEG